MSKVLHCDHEETVTYLDGQMVELRSQLKGVEVKAKAGYPLVVDFDLNGEKYRLDCCWGDSFAIYHLIEKPFKATPVDMLDIQEDHPVWLMIGPMRDD